MASSNINNSWNTLSNLQRKSAEWTEGPVLILAGPGSGKTRVLTCRIARLLESTEADNFRILGLTFTNKAADEMRTRLASMVPGYEHRLFLGTFHSFCAEILRQHGSHIGIRPNFAIYSQTEDLESILNDAVNEAKKKYEILSDMDKKTLPVIHRLKSLLIFPDKCRDAFQDRDFADRMTIVYPAYEKELSKHNALDFDSLILRCYELFVRYPAFAKRYRTVYSYICVDEFQDTNNAQYELLKSILGEEHNNIFVVADDDQIIYQWNGASHKRIEEYVEDYKPTIIQLPVNYRCPAEIVDLANNLIKYNFLRSENKVPLISFIGSAGSDTVRLFPAFKDEEEESTGIASDIKLRHTNCLDNVVVIARNRRLLYRVEKALKEAGIAATIAQRKDNFESTPIKWLHSVLKLANNQQDRKILEAVCGTFKQLTGAEIDESEVEVEANASDQTLFRLWIKHAEKASLDKAGRRVIMSAANHLGGGGDFITFCDEAFNWYEMLTNLDDAAQEGNAELYSLYSEERAVWNELIREMSANFSRAMSLEAFLQELQMRSKESPSKRNVVRLFTIHSSKGKEFDYVYLVGLVEDELPSFQSIKRGDKSPEMEEERRNCFVAITRTSRSLTLSYANYYNGWKKRPSRFLYEMGLLS